jgi:hypothetical protein
MTRNRSGRWRTDLRAENRGFTRLYADYEPNDYVMFYAYLDRNTTDRPYSLVYIGNSCLRISNAVFPRVLVDVADRCSRFARDAYHLFRPLAVQPSPQSCDGTRFGVRQRYWARPHRCSSLGAKYF